MAAESNVICFADARLRYRNVRYSVVCVASTDDEAVDFIMDVVAEVMMTDSIDMEVSGDDLAISFVGALLHREKLAILCDKLQEDGIACRLASETFSRWA